MKTCFKCGVGKPLSEFYKHPMMGDGHLGKCKACTKLDVSKNYRDRRTKYQAYERERCQDPARKAKTAEYQRRSQTRNAMKWRARRITYRAVKRGKLKKLPCLVCGNEKVEAHHLDYMDPYKIEWLCFKHHCERHGRQAD